jgi:acyl-CoA synthetase (AMP-forming)/AMP-acid ligase II
MTETSAVVTFISGRDYDKQVPGSVGRALPGIDVRIDAPDANGVGEIIAKGPNVMIGYFENPEATAQTLQDGWLHTGDIGRVDEDGFVSIVDRAKDVIIRGGENISSLEVEAALYEHPAVLDVAVSRPPRCREEGPRSSPPVDGGRAAAADPRRLFLVQPTEIWLLDDLPARRRASCLGDEERAPRR